MKVRLLYKIFLAFLLTSLMVVVIMNAIMWYFGKRNFEDFVNKMEMERLEELATVLSGYYQAHQGWGSLKSNPMEFSDMFRAAPPHHLEVGPPGIDSRPEPPHDFHPGPSDMQKSPGPGMEPGLSLYDAGMNIIAGRAALAKDRVLKEINVAGKAVGWLGLERRRDFKTPLEAGFMYRQGSMLLAIGFAAILLAALVSYFFSRHLLRPVEQLASAAHSLTLRKFDTRVPPHTKDELGQLAADFNNMAQTLERYEYMRRQWISDISHELRTPIAILRGEIEAIQDGIHEASREAMESIHAEIMLLNSLVNDLHELSIADMNNLSMNLGEVHVMEVLQEVIKANESRFSQAGISIEADPSLDASVVLVADEDRLFQLFSNILENTLRYTEKPGRLKVWQLCADKHVHINFEDTKPGVPDSELDRIFDRLYRVDQSRSRRMGGSGLGLAICRSIVELLGGGIRAINSSLGGLRIEVILPLSEKV